jgi:hypothetical protein
VLWTANVVIYVLGIWFGMYWWKGLEVWTVEWFFFIAGYAVVIFMWASMLYPPEFSSGLQCEAYFFGNRRLHAVLPIAWLVTILSYLFLTSLEHIAGHAA